MQHPNYAASKVFFGKAHQAPYLVEQRDATDENDYQYGQQMHDVAVSNPQQLYEAEADAAAGGSNMSSRLGRRVSSFGSLLPNVASASSLDVMRVLSRSSVLDSNATAAAVAVAGSIPQAGDAAAASSARSLETVSSRRLQQDRIPTRQLDYYRSATTAITPDWRLRDRMKTVGVGLILALNVGTDPPDLTKPLRCAVLECWIDPKSVSRSKAKEIIGERLEQQYSKWQLARTSRPLKYRRALDPTTDDVRHLCLQLRRQARNERILLHYNGHGVPRPTMNGEIWVFDKNHTEYIPLSVMDLRQWMGKPSILVLDCRAAGILIPSFCTPLVNSETQQQQQEVVGGGVTGLPSSNATTATSATSTTRSASNATGVPIAAGTRAENPPFARTVSMDELSSQWVNDTIVLCPCSENEWLPMSPDYPADIFTSCLTTPIPVALRWFVRHHADSMSGLDPEAVDAIPGKSNDRKTPLGELNWIFTAVTDSIAWNSLPKPLFQRLFRQDLLVASMFRNFLLADRILRSLGCTPMSYPPLPPGMADHPLWRAWDLACETMLFQLMQDGVLGNHVLVPSVKERKQSTDEDDTDGEGTTPALGSAPGISQPPQHQPVHLAQQPSHYSVSSSTVSSPFFSEQLTAFEVWLEYAAIHKMQLASGMGLEPPEQLPVVLQVLLSQVHRIRALRLLRRFLDLGPWAVNLSLSLGIFPYVMKLLQSPEYKSLLVSIWASILAFDASCRVDLLKDGAFHHFVQHLMWGLNSATIDVAEAARERTMAGFVLAAVCHEYPAGQAECVRLNLHGNCCALLSSYEQGEKSRDETAELHLPAHFRVWLCMCLANMVKENNPTQNEAYGASVHNRLITRLNDRDAEVRACVCYAFGCLIGSPPTQGSSRPSSTQDLAGLDQQQQPAAVNAPGLTSPPGVVLPGTIPVPVGPTTGVAVHSTFNTAGASVPNLQWRPQQLGPVQGTRVAHLGQTIALPDGRQFLNQPVPLRPSVQAQDMPTQYVVHGQPLQSHPGMGTAATGFLVGTNKLVGGGQPPLIAPQPLRPQSIQVEQQRPLKPTVYEDRRRLELDLTVIESVQRCVDDASVVVRYEAAMALASAVAKYLDAFVVVAEEALVAKAPLTELESRAKSVPLPRGLDRNDVERFAPIWQSLRSLQHDDPFAPITLAANKIVSFVHEHLLRIRINIDPTSDPQDRSGFLAGIQEELSASERSVAGVPSTPPSSRSRTRASTSLRPKTKPKLRRVLSEGVTGQDDAISMEKRRSSGVIPTSNRESDLEDNLGSYQLPKSEFYQWKKQSFNTNSQSPEVDEDPSDLDPLSPEGALKAYQERRNLAVRRKGAELSARYANLAPKPPKPKKQSIEMLLEEEDEEAAEAAEEAASKKKNELKLSEQAVLRNEGAHMTSLLRFHPFEDILVSCSAAGHVSLWDTTSGNRLNWFENRNPAGTRMTSGSWMNEESSSLFYIGCDDGTVRIWGDLVHNIGGPNVNQPFLVSAFHALPMKPDQRGSGLICEWQQFSGRMMTGGNSSKICCWDLEAEQRLSQIDTNTEASVTTLTTAWDFEVGNGLLPQGYHGIGPDILISGHSDGSLKIFDLRMHGSGSKLRDAESSSRARRQRMVKGYNEHKSWVVATAFTSYSSRYELVSGTVAGEIKAWDMRASSSIRTLEVQRSTMTALSVHPQIPIVATGSHAQFIKVLTLDGDTLQVVRYHEKLSNQRIGPVSCLAFHRSKPILAAGSTDSLIGLLTPAGSRSRR